MMGLSQTRKWTNGRRAEQETCKLRLGDGKEGGGCGGLQFLNRGLNGCSISNEGYYQVWMRNEFYEISVSSLRDLPEYLVK